MLDTQRALAEQGIRLRSVTAGSHKTTCPRCSDSRRKKTDPCLSVTVEPDGAAVWKCHNCGWTGNAIERFERPQRKPARAYRKPIRPENPHRPDKLVKWFGHRGISRAVVERMEIYRTKTYFPQIEGEADCIAFPYEWRGELRNVKYRTADKLFRQEKDPEPVFYNADSIEAGQDLIIAEGEIDVLSFLEAGFQHVVSLPNGAPQQAEQSDRRYEPLATHADELEGVSRILIATDMDTAGEALASELARRLGKDRCFRVSFPVANDHQLKDSNEVLVDLGADAVRMAVENAAPWPIDGLHGVDDFLEDVLNLYHGLGPQPESTGFAEFDKAFRYQPGQFIVVTGIPNHGKSRWLAQVALQTLKARGERWAIFSPETGGANAITELAEIAAGLPFHNGPNVRMSERELKDALDDIRDNFVFISAKDHTPSLDWILQRAKAAVLRHGTRHLIVDPYNEVEASRPEKMTETEFISQFISKCKRFAQHHDVTVWIVVHPTKIKAPPGESKEPIPSLYDLAGSAHWRNKADAALVVYRDYEKDQTTVFAKKIRFQPRCGEPGSVSFQFVGYSRRFTDMAKTYTRLGATENS